MFRKMLLQSRGSSLSAAAIFLLICLAGAEHRAAAQLPTCAATPNTIYTIKYPPTTLSNFNPLLPVSGTNPTVNTLPTPASSAIGLTVGQNLNGVGPSPTFYTVDVNNYIYYYNGTNWVNTTHLSGGAPFSTGFNIAAGGGYIYSLSDGGGNIYRYDGTGNATFLVTLPFSSGQVLDLAADCNGNFYTLCVVPGAAGLPPALRQYSGAGTLLQTWPLTGTLPSTIFGAGGWALLGTELYFNTSDTLYRGVISPGNVTVTSLGYAPSLNTNDWGTCAIGGLGGGVTASIDTGYYCGTGPGVAISATGASAYTWSVVSGPAVLSATTGSNITVTATGTSLIRVVGTLGSCGGDSTDTVAIIVPTATVDAGPADTILSCGAARDTLAGTLNGTTSGLTYNIAWSPAAAVIAGGNTLTPIVQSSGTTTYTLMVTTPTTQGGCAFTDTVQISAQAAAVTAGFNHTVRYGCTADTVDFTNTSTSVAPGAPLAYTWDFGDGATDTAKNPTHIYTAPGTYTVKLVARNAACADSLVISMPLSHALLADFMASADSLCQRDTVFFTNTSQATIQNGIAPRYFWDFGDGTTDTVKNPKHLYQAGGVYVVTLVARDFVPCADTARDTIVIDSLPYVHIVVPDTMVCQGQAADFSAQLASSGLAGLVWSFGDGTLPVADTPRAAHGFDQPGVYNVVLSADYRRCADTSDTAQIWVQPYPAIAIGPDTSICPGGEPILFTARLSGAGGIPGATQVVWNTGDTATSILVRHHGLYWARAANKDGCSAADTASVAKDCYLDIPNVFSPNGDGVNDYFWPRQSLSSGIVRFSMNIYNRWGQKIWETAQVDGRGWDGRFNGEAQPTGVYIYQMEAELKNGYRESYRGNVTLLR